MSAKSTSTVAERQRWIELWLHHMETCDQLLLAGLQNAVGPKGDLREAYREWYKQQMREHDAMIFGMAERFEKAQGNAS